MLQNFRRWLDLKNSIFLKTIFYGSGDYRYYSIGELKTGGEKSFYPLRETGKIYILPVFRLPTDPRRNDL